jgi:hypothetical protein
VEKLPCQSACWLSVVVRARFVLVIDRRVCQVRAVRVECHRCALISPLRLLSCGVLAWTRQHVPTMLVSC